MGRRSPGPLKAALALLLALSLLSPLAQSAAAADDALLTPAALAGGAFDRLAVAAGVVAGPTAAAPLDAAGLARIACQTLAAESGCAHPGFSRLGSAAVSADGRVVAFVGDRGKGLAVFASVDDGQGGRSLQLIAGEQWDQGGRSCRGPELGVGPRPAKAPLCFASLDLDGRLAVAARSSPPPGLDGDSLTVAFSGQPSAASGDPVATTVPFSSQPGLWTVTVDLSLLEDNSAVGGNHDGKCDADESCRWQFRRAPARRVVQVGQSVDGRAVASVAVDALDAAASPNAPRPRSGEYHLTARVSTVDGQELLLNASHVEPWTSSYYMHTADPASASGLGCALAPRLAGSGQPESMVVLDYARPRSWVGSDGKTVYGASIWDENEHYPDTGQLATATEALMQAYVECTPAGASAPRLLVVVGTSNHGQQVTREHGRAWAEMVNAIGAWVVGRGLGDRLAVAGGNDMESAYNTAAVTRAWVDGYGSVGQWPLYNFGDAANCPMAGTTARPGPCANGWTQEDHWYVSWGAPLARVVPEIYATGGGNAASWQQLVLYSTLAHPERPPMRIDGVMTQRQAVEQVCGIAPLKSDCQGVENTPEQAWAQLSARLASDVRTAAAGLTMRSTDIKYCYRDRCQP